MPAAVRNPAATGLFTAKPELAASIYGNSGFAIHTAKFEESFKLNRTILFRISAMVALALAPLAAAGQVNPEAAPSSEQAASPYKYEAYVGVAYSRLRQVPDFVQRIAGRKGVTGPRLGKIFSTHRVGGLLQVGNRPRQPVKSRRTHRCIPPCSGRESTPTSTET